MDNAGRFKPLDHINKIAELIRSLTYGEMIELASELRKTAGETVQIDKIAELIRSLTYGEMIELAFGLREAAGEMGITAGKLSLNLFPRGGVNPRGTRGAPQLAVGRRRPL